MKREEFIKKLRESAERLAKSMDCNNFETSKGTCGIWDEISDRITMTEMLEEMYGDCSTEWTFTNDDKTIKVKTRFRFGHPCISVRQEINEPCGDCITTHTNFIELEFNNEILMRDNIESEKYKGGIVENFMCTQIMLWHDWQSLRDQLMTALDDDIKKIVTL